MSTGLDSLLTMSQQMLGVLQPRPSSTLHVGGGLKTDGAISAQSLGVTGNATVSGTLGVTGATTLSTLGVTGATTLAALTAGTTRLGQLNVGAGATSALAGDVAASRDSSPTTGVYYFGNTGGKYLYYDGSNFQLTGGRLNGQLTAGMAQALIGSYATSVNWNWFTQNVWQATPASFSAACTGVPVRIEGIITFAFNNPSAFYLIGLMVDGGVVATLAQIIENDANVPRTTTLVYYMTPSAATHTFAICVYLYSAGNLGLSTAQLTGLWVTEQRA